MDLTAVLRAVRDNNKEPRELAPLAERGVIPVNRGQAWQENVVNFNYIS
jgi:hypothetical protein